MSYMDPRPEGLNTEPAPPSVVETLRTPDLKTVTFDAFDVLRELSKWAAGMSSWQDDPKGPYLRDIITDARAILDAPTPAAQSAGQEAIYQVRTSVSGWADLTPEQFEDSNLDKRIVIAAPVNGGEREPWRGACPHTTANMACQKCRDQHGADYDQRASDDSHLRAIMERDAWRNAMVGLCNSRDWPTTPDEAADHLRKRLHPERAADAQQVKPFGISIDGNAPALSLDAAIANMCTDSRGIIVLRNAVASLREFGRYVDEEGEDTDALEALCAALTSPAKVVGDDQHPDDAAVDRFSVAMKAKLAKKRAQGRGGWDDERVCSPDDLARMLVDHVRKGDPVDVGNFAMMLFNRPDAGAALCRAALSADGGEDKRDAVMIPRTLIERLLKWRLCMSYNDSYFGEPAGELKRLTHEIQRKVDASGVTDEAR